MRILYVINNFSIGGAETGLLHLIDSGFFEDASVEVVALFKGTNQLLQRLEDRGVAARTLIHEADMKYHLMPKAYTLLRKELRAYDPDLVLLSLPQANIVGRLAAWDLRAKVVTFEHNVRYGKALYKPLLRMTSKYVDAVLYDSERTRMAVEKNYTSYKTRPWLYTPLVSLKENTVVRDYAHSDPVKILTASRLNEQKNHATSIRAIGLLRDRGYLAQLTIAGEGEQRGALEALVTSLNLKDHVLLPGFVDDWSGLRKESDIFLQPSLWEGLCIGVLEAMADGMPVVASDVGGMQDYGKDGHNMLKITEPTNAALVADLVASLIDSEERCEQIGQHAAEDALRLFGEETVKQQLKDVFGHLRRLVA
ncbi:MAG: glycosyltransferase [Rickettsiales bacterium]|nr:glycosyltransferase [Rickettsiales bacterium]